MKTTKAPSDARFIKTLPAGLVGMCWVCKCEVETESGAVPHAMHALKVK